MNHYTSDRSGRRLTPSQAVFVSAAGSLVKEKLRNPRGQPLGNGGHVATLSREEFRAFLRWCRSGVTLDRVAADDPLPEVPTPIDPDDEEPE